jgi:uncharacterized membrane protein
VAGGALAMLVLVVREIRSDPWLLVFAATIMAIGLLTARYPAVGRGVGSFVEAYLLFCLWMLAAVAPGALALILARTLTAASHLWLQMTVFVAWAGLLFAAIWFIATESRRTRLFDALSPVGGLAPFVYAVNVLLLALPFFGALTLVLMEKDVVTLTGSTERVFDFYTWHFLDAIPLLKVNETLHWDPPMTYEQARVGWLLLLFKVTVIVPVIGVFGGYWKYLQNAKSKTAG